jgi:Zn-dependent oligopeptidase
MKRISKTLVSILLVFVAIVTMAGCNDSSLFTRLETALNNSTGNVDSLDHVAVEDMSDTNLNPFKTDASNQTYITLAFDNLDKVDEVIDLFKDIKDQQMMINELKTSLKVSIHDLKSNIKAFKDSGVELTDEEKTTIETYINEIKTANEQLKNTIGKVYLKMRNLRGKYNLANLDNIITNLTQVKAAITTRVESATRISEIIIDINNILSSKMG